MSVMPRRFVILHHTGYGREHWDLMLEHEGVLWTWQLLADPTAAARPDASIEAVRIADHRLHYLDYEGPISRGRGEVRRMDGGEIRGIEAGPDMIEVDLAGKRLRGRFRLSRTADDRWTWRPASVPS